MANILAADMKYQRIEKGSFIRPKAGIIDNKLHLPGASNAKAPRIHQQAVRRIQKEIRLHLLGLAHDDIRRNHSLREGRIDILPNFYIADMDRIAEKQIHLTKNTGKPKFILILQIRSVAPLEHQHLQRVFSRMQKLGQIHFACHVADLAVSRKAIIHKKIEAGIHAFKVNMHRFLRQLFFRKPQGANIKPARIIDRHMRRIHRERIVYIGILRAVISAPQLGLPALRNAQLVKPGRCKTGRCKIGQLGFIGIIVKIPIPAKRYKSITLAPYLSLRQRLCAVRNQISMRLFTAHMKGRKRFVKVKTKIHDFFSFHGFIKVRRRGACRPEPSPQEKTQARKEMPNVSESALTILALTLSASSTVKVRSGARRITRMETLFLPTPTCGPR